MSTLWPALRHHGFLIVLAAIVVGLSTATTSFLTPANLAGLAHAMAPITIIASGMALVVLAGKLDISVGSIAFLSTTLGALLVTAGWPIAVGFLVTVLAGTALGALNGLIVVGLSMNPLITTLGTMIAYRGLAMQISDAQVIVLPDALRRLGNLALGPVSLDTAIAAALVVAMHLLHTRSAFGRQVTAIGSNEVAARRIGLPIGQHLLACFTLSGALAATGGFLAAAQVGAVTSFLGQGLEFTAVAVVVVGGISLFGGSGNLLRGVLLGTLTFELIRNGLNHLNANPYAYRLVGGAVIFVAMYADALRAGERSRG